MFCPNCGSDIQDGSNSCSKCGSMIEMVTAANSTSQKNGYIDKSRTKKAIIIVSAISAALIVLMFVFSIVFVDTPEKAAERYVTGLLTKNYFVIKHYSICSPEYYIDKLDDVPDDLEIESISAIQSAIIEPSMISYSIYYYKNYGLDLDVINDVREVKVEVSVSQNGVSESHTTTLYVAKYFGLWKVLPTLFY